MRLWRGPPFAPTVERAPPYTTPGVFDMRQFLGRQAEVFVPVAVLQAMEAETERHAPKETGGVLLGYVDRAEAMRVQVTRQVGPGPDAVHRCHFFNPDSEWQAREIATAY